MLPRTNRPWLPDIRGQDITAGNILRLGCEVRNDLPVNSDGLTPNEAKLLRRIVGMEEAIQKLWTAVMKKPAKTMAPQAMIEAIIEATAKEFRISTCDLTSRSRANHIIRPRQIAIYLAFRMTAMSGETIAKEMGLRSWGTVSHARRKVEERIGEDAELGRRVEKIRDSIA